MKTDIRCLTALLGIGGRQKRATASQLSSPISDVASTPTVYDPKDSVIHRVPEEKLAPFVTYGSSCLCSFAQAAKQTSSESWAHAAPPSPRYSKDDFKIVNGFDSQTVMNTIESTIEEINPELRKLNLDIWEHPEVGFKEHYAHDTLTAFMSERGFTVTKHYLGLDTAWRAEYSRGIGGRVIGLQSEMDALPNIGHACGHNLIAISGVAIALALKAALEEHNVSGKIVLLGTPAEESGGGKIKLLEQGAYSDMDVCMMFVFRY
ncbi:hypothetical protein EW026_g1972 [Hermanssonia centrifuga]|uniref:Amidohydrolase n=1 Tax=Hermanssonia centrifuga TaxID=98765 RepID=A0A4S4KPU2_9APHY|nr:hypothetical protein EW026_g1972 [Hermanssonia centrifuga]